MNATVSQPATATRKWTRSGPFERLSTSREAIAKRATIALHRALQKSTDLPNYDLHPQKQASACTAAFRVGSWNENPRIVTVAISYETVVAFSVFNQRSQITRTYRAPLNFHSKTTDRFIREFTASKDVVTTFEEADLHKTLREELNIQS